MDEVYSDNELQRAMDLFKRTDRMHKRVFAKCVGNMEIGGAQHRILMWLSHHGPAVSQKDMAKAFEISPAAVAVTLKKLEESGYIEKTAHENDGRYNFVSITQKGREVVDHTHETFQQIDRMAFTGMTEEELKILGDGLSKMYLNLKNIYESDQIPGEDDDR